MVHFKGKLKKVSDMGGVLLVNDELDLESINTTQFFLNLVEDIKDREQSRECLL
jgi:hypothetical protein